MSKLSDFDKQIFLDFVRRCLLKARPIITTQTRREMSNVLSRVTDRFRDDGDKDGLLAGWRDFEKRYQIMPRQFHVVDPETFKEYVSLYAQSQPARHLLTENTIARGQAFLQFTPSNRNDPPPKVVYTIMIFNDSGITTLATLCQGETPGRGLLESVTTKPWGLFETWSADTIGEYFDFIDDVIVAEKLGLL